MARHPDKETRGLLQFFRTAGLLKEEPRRGWVEKLGERHPESVADHSCLTALITMVLSDSMGLNTERAVKMALLHDLPEALVCDTIPGELARDEKVRREDSAMEELLSSLPKRVAANYRSIWDEFLLGASPEASLVSQVDKLEMALQARVYAEVHGDDHVREFIETTDKFLTNKNLRKVFEASGRTRTGL